MYWLGQKKKETQFLGDFRPNCNRDNLTLPIGE